MTKAERLRRLKMIERVLEGCVPSGRHTGQRRARQYERIDEAIAATQELQEEIEPKSEVTE